MRARAPAQSESLGPVVRAGGDPTMPDAQLRAPDAGAILAVRTYYFEYTTATHARGIRVRVCRFAGDLVWEGPPSAALPPPYKTIGHCLAGAEIRRRTQSPLAAPGSDARGPTAHWSGSRAVRRKAGAASAAAARATACSLMETSINTERWSFGTAFRGPFRDAVPTSAERSGGDGSAKQRAAPQRPRRDGAARERRRSSTGMNAHAVRS
jgi:hypothetical protein